MREREREKNCDEVLGRKRKKDKRERGQEIDKGERGKKENDERGGK